jgi:ketosteroid isomerase-like protein
MRWIAAVLLVVALPACNNRAGGGTSADSSAVMAAIEEYRQAWVRGDTTAALRPISDDIRILISGVPDIVGKEATRNLFVSEMVTYQVPVLTLQHQDVIVRGDHVIDIGTYEEIQVPQTGAPIRSRGRFMTIWRNEGGQWRIIRYMLNDLPAPPAPPRSNR